MGAEVMMKPAARAGGAAITDVEADVLSALVNLGYEARAAEEAVTAGKKAVGAGDFEKLLRAALGGMSAGKKK
jgi:Holliday junction resolvasome RuvABC DNA-binding subunit